MTGMLREWRRMPHLLGGAVLMLGAVAAWPWFASSPVPLPAPAAIVTASAGLAPLPPATAFGAIAERPLFSPSRRPVLAALAPSLRGPATRYRLLGLMTVGGRRRALLGDGPRHFEVSEGVALDSWSVERIEDDRVILSSPEGEAILSLRRTGADLPTAPMPR